MGQGGKGGDPRSEGQNPNPYSKAEYWAPSKQIFDFCQICTQMDKIVFVAFNCREKILPPFLLCVVREESRHREKKGGSQVTARARERERRRYSM